MRGIQVSLGNRVEASFANPKIWCALKQAVLVSLSALAPVLLNGCAGTVSSGSPTGNPPSSLEITNIQYTSGTPSTAQIAWTTNVASDSAVNYGTSPSYGLGTPVDPAMVTSHQITLSGLAAGTTYYYQVISSDSKGHHGKSGGQSFKTLGFTISGTISPATGGSRATLTLGGAATAMTAADTSGSYTFTGLPNGTYAIVPSRSGFTFTPSSQTATINGANVTAVNFADAATSVAPTITAQPVNQTVTAGHTATFTVVATGTAPLSYQWERNGVNVGGATAASYTTLAATTADSGATFRVVVSNTAGSVTSAAATLTVTAGVVAPSVTTQPANQTVTSGQTATLSVTAAGTAPLMYQWKKNGIAIAGATSSSYITPVTTLSDSGSSFVVVVSNSAGNVTSRAATLTVNAAAPTVNLSPTSLTFGDRIAGTSSSAQFVTFTNTSTFPLTFGTEPITGDFSFAGQGTCSTSLAAGASCAMSVKFTPTAIGTRTGTLTVNDNASTSPQVVALTGTGVSATAPLAIATASVPAGTVGQAYSTQLNATGGTTPYTWSVSSGSLPAGLRLSAAGVISGIPTTAGSSTFMVTVNDGTSQTASSLTLAVASLTATSCTLYVSSSGSDSNPGTLVAPWQTPQKAANSAAAGQTVCFRGGAYTQTVTSGYQQTFNNSGSAGNPIVFTNYPGEIAVIQGSTRINGSYLTFRGTPQSIDSCEAINPCGLIFEGSQGYNIDAIDICCAVNSNPHFVTFDHVEIRKATYHAGLYQEGCDNAITGSYIHDNGAFNANRSEDNGIYWSVTPPGCANGGLIANNLIENNYSKGIQLYDGGSSTSPANVTVTENTSVNNGAQGAVVWGDHNVFVNNVLYNNNNLSGGAAAGAQGGLYAGLANLVDQNLTFDPSGNSGWDNPTGCCITNNKQADPLFVNILGLDWHILPSSPAIGFSNLNYIQPVDKDGVSRGSSPVVGAYQH